MRGAKMVAKGLAVFGLAVAPMAAGAQDAASYTEAMQALVDTIARTDTAPAATDPVLVRARREAEALRAVIGTPKFPITQLSTMKSLCVPALNVMMSYFDVGLATRTKSATTDAARLAIKTQVETENATRYLDQVLPFVLLNVRCNASHMPAIEAFVASIPAGEMTSVQREGVAQIRSGAREQIKGLITGASDSTAGEALRLRLLDELAHDIDLMLIPLTPADKAEIAQDVRKLRPRLSAAGKARADTVIAALAKSGCGQICAAVGSAP